MSTLNLMGFAALGGESIGSRHSAYRMRVSQQGRQKANQPLSICPLESAMASVNSNPADVAGRPMSHTRCRFMVADADVASHVDCHGPPADLVLVAGQSSNLSGVQLARRWSPRLKVDGRRSSRW